MTQHRLPAVQNVADGTEKASLPLFSKSQYFYVILSFSFLLTMGKFAWILFFALAAVLDPASCSTKTPPVPPSAAVSQKSTLKQLTSSGEFSLATAVSIIALAFLSVLHWRPTKSDGAEAATEMEESAPVKTNLLQEDGREEGGAGADAEVLKEWRSRTLQLVKAVEWNRPRSAEHLELGLQEGIPLVKQGLAKLQDTEVPEEEKVELKDAAEAARALLKRASRRLTGLWTSRADQARAKLENGMQPVRDGLKELLPGTLVKAKDDFMLKLKRLKRFIEAGIKAHKVLQPFAEKPMPITPLYKRVQDLELLIRDGTSLLFSTLGSLRKAWEDKAQALRDAIARCGPDAESAREELKLLEKTMTPALRKINKLSVICPDADQDDADDFMPK